MATEIFLPAMSPTMEEGNLAKWLVAEGDVVKPGRVIAEIETDKATMELESDEGGVVLKLLVAAGGNAVKVGTPIAMMGEAGENYTTTPPPPSAQPVLGLVEDKTRGLGTIGDLNPMSPSVAEGPVTNKQTVREALRDAMAEEMRRDEKVFVIGEEVAEYQGAYKVTQGLLQEFGDKRVIDTPITEHGFAGIAVGAAFGGLRPVVEFMTFNFAMQAIDHIINSAAKTNYMSGGQMGCPIVFRGPNGAAARVAAQHSQNYGPWYASVPGLIVIAPYDAADCKGLLKSAIRSPDPVVFLENELVYGKSFEVPEGEHLVPIGKAAVKRSGNDVTLVAYSIAVGIALEAAEKLAAEGIDAEVIDLRTLRPLDTATVLASLKKTNRIVVVEEGWPTCSIASEITAVVMEHGFDDLDAPVLRVTNKDVPLPYANNLEKLALIKVDDVISAVRKVCNR
jgi:pyruvate dehydrogenase E1 component beta subunit